MKTTDDNTYQKASKNTDAESKHVQQQRFDKEVNERRRKGIKKNGTEDQPKKEVKKQ